MIIQRVLIDENEDAIYQFAEVYEGDECYPDGVWHTVGAIREEEKQVLICRDGHADNEQLATEDFVFKYFHEPRIVRWCDAKEIPFHTFDIWDNDQRRWIRLTELGISHGKVHCLDREVNEVDIALDTPIRI